MGGRILYLLCWKLSDLENSHPIESNLINICIKELGNEFFPLIVKYFPFSIKFYHDICMKVNCRVSEVTLNMFHLNNNVHQCIIHKCRLHHFKIYVFFKTVFLLILQTKLFHLWKGHLKILINLPIQIFSDNDIWCKYFYIISPKIGLASHV